MKPLILAILLLSHALFLLTVSNAQNLLNDPESVVYDSVNNRYLVSNWGDGNIIQIDSVGEQSYFSTALNRLAGLHIEDNILYTASNLPPFIGLVGFDLATAEIVVIVNISGSGLVNDIDTDTSGNLYITDFYDSKVYRVSLNDYTYSTFVNTGLNMPNGILFDEQYNRLLTVCQNEAGYPMKAINVIDSSVSVVVYTHLPAVDGITKDNEGRVYLSSWSSNSVHRYNAAISNPPEIVSSGHSGPADIYFNKLDNILAVPNFYYNTVDFIYFEPTLISEIEIPEQISFTQNYPNPFNSSTIIEYSLLTNSDIRIDIFDITGRKIETLTKTNQQAGKHQITWKTENKATGVYYYKIITGDYIQARKMMLLK